MARPRIKIDWEEFDKLCQLQATLTEIAGWFGCSEDTIERAVKREQGVGFAEYFGQKRQSGKIALRRKQWQVALGGDKTMLIFLGKQYLGQKDEFGFNHNGLSDTDDAREKLARAIDGIADRLGAKEGPRQALTPTG